MVSTYETVETPRMGKIVPSPYGRMIFPRRIATAPEPTPMMYQRWHTEQLQHTRLTMEFGLTRTWVRIDYYDDWIETTSWLPCVVPTKGK